MRRLIVFRIIGAALLVLGGLVAEAHAELIMKVLVVNPSETEAKEFEIRNPLPPEVKPEHVLDADGLKVDYDSQAGTYILVGRVTLKPKESVTKRVLLEDVWVIPADRFSSFRRELSDIMQKLTDTSYEERGQILHQAIERRLSEIEESQEQPFVHPVQHITRYREDMKSMQMVEAELVSLRQLMVMAALNPQQPKEQPVVVIEGAGATGGGEAEKGGLSILATWRLIFIILGLLGFVSLSFFLVWQRQLKLQLAKQAAKERAEPGNAAGNGNGASPAGLEPLPPPIEPRFPGPQVKL
jgi:hypothetical protein